MMRKKTKGFSLVEILLATAILGFVVIPFLGTTVNLSRIQLRTRIKSQAVHFSREGIEIAYNLSLQNWGQFASLNGQYHPIINVDGNFIFVPGPESGLAVKYQREIIIEKTVRNKVTGNLFKTGDTGVPVPDPKTMKVTSKVTWDDFGHQETVQFVTYLSDLNQS